MSWWKSGPKLIDEKEKAGKERRKDPRIGGHFKVRYSGADEDKIIIGYATIVDLSRHGFGLQGARGLKPGMELALFLELVDTNETICIPQAYVSWTAGRRFGVELRAAGDKEPFWMECLAGQS